MVEHAESRTHDLAAMLDTWQERVDHLQTMESQASKSVRRCYYELIQRMRSVLRDASDLLLRAPSMTPEQWIDARTEILAALQTLQREYNAAVADWPQE